MSKRIKKQGSKLSNIQVKPKRKQAKTETASVGGNTTYYVHGPKGMHAQQAEDEWKWMVQDGLGSVRSVVDNAVTVQESLGFAPDGKPIGGVGLSQTMYGFTGEPTDPNGLIHLRERYYSPDLGAFISQDPFEGVVNDAMSLNRYAYAHANPVNRMDPSGLTPINQTLNNIMASNPLGFVQMMNAGACLVQQQICPNPPFCTNTPPPIGTPSPTGTPTATPNPCVPTPTMTPTPSGTPVPTVTPIPLNMTAVNGLSSADLDLMALNIFYEAHDYPEHWEAIANVWFNRLADPHATTTDIQRLLDDNSAGWGDFVRGFSRGDGTQLDPLHLTSTDIDNILETNYRAYASSSLRPDVVAARNSYPNPQYQGMLAFFHADAGRPAALRVCEMECVAAAPEAAVAANLRRRGRLQLSIVEGSRTLIMNNGIFWPSASAGPNSFCGTCCERNVPL